jgi:hypothetical protein
MIGIHPEIRIELARRHRDGQIAAAAQQRLAAEHDVRVRPRRAQVAGRVIPRLRPQQSRQ